MSNPSYDTVADVVKIVSSQRLLWWLAPVTPISPSESDIISRIEKQVQRQDDAHPCVPFIGKDEQESDGTKSSRADTLRAVFPDVKISNLSKANKRRGPRVNGRQLYGIFHGDFGVGRHILKLKFLDVEVGERVVEDSADGSAVMLRLEAGYYVIGVEANLARSAVCNESTLWPLSLGAGKVAGAADRNCDDNGESPHDPWEEFDLRL